MDIDNQIANLKALLLMLDSMRTSNVYTTIKNKLIELQQVRK